jgi:hypothetical protein
MTRDGAPRVYFPFIGRAARRHPPDQNLRFRELAQFSFCFRLEWNKRFPPVYQRYMYDRSTVQIRGVRPLRVQSPLNHDIREIQAFELLLLFLR